MTWGCAVSSAATQACCLVARKASASLEKKASGAMACWLTGGLARFGKGAFNNNEKGV
jgi:hypothetical protein